MNHSSIHLALFAIGRNVRARAFGWGFVAILASIAVFSTRLVLETQPHTAHKTTASTAQKHMLDYSIQDLSVWRTSLDGTTRNHLSAKSLSHYRDDLSSVLEHPLLIAESTLPFLPIGIAIADADADANTSKPPQSKASPAIQHSHIINTLTADLAYLRNEGESIEFKNGVKVLRQAVDTGLPDSMIMTDSLTVLPDDNQVFTQSAVELTQGDTMLSSNKGIRYKHNDAVLQFDGAVHAVLTPPKPINTP